MHVSVVLVIQSTLIAWYVMVIPSRLVQCQTVKLAEYKMHSEWSRRMLPSILSHLHQLDD